MLVNNFACLNKVMDKLKCICLIYFWLKSKLVKLLVFNKAKSLIRWNGWRQAKLYSLLVVDSLNKTNSNLLMLFICNMMFLKLFQFAPNWCLKKTLYILYKKLFPFFKPKQARLASHNHWRTDLKNRSWVCLPEFLICRKNLLPGSLIYRIQTKQHPIINFHHLKAQVIQRHALKRAICNNHHLKIK